MTKLGLQQSTPGFVRMRDDSTGRENARLAYSWRWPVEMLCRVVQHIISWRVLLGLNVEPPVVLRTAAEAWVCSLEVECFGDV